jgi:hypothetical protein
MCDNCHRKVKTQGAVIANKYGQYCTNCRATLKRLVSAGAAASSRTQDRVNHLKDVIQPWDRNGKPNREFIRNYHEEAQGIFTREELEKYG